jgi:superfamily II DNA/RNA helicase
VGTIALILDFVKDRTINRDIDTIALDEADMLFDLGFMNQTNELFDLINNFKLQKIACSASLHQAFSNKLKKFFSNAEIFQIEKTV